MTDARRTEVRWQIDADILERARARAERDGRRSIGWVAEQFLAAYASGAAGTDAPRLEGSGENARSGLQRAIDGND